MGTWRYNVQGPAPVGDAYASFYDFNNYPDILKGVQAVFQQEDGSLLWEVNTPGGFQDWVLVITEQVPNVKIVWQSVDRSSTYVEFTFTPRGSDQINVAVLIQYNGPSGIDPMASRIVNPWPSH